MQNDLFITGCVKRMVVDLSSVSWTFLLEGKDGEHGRMVQHEGKDVLVNSAGYGYEKAMTFLVETMQEFDIQPKDVIIVKEGMNSKVLRKTLMPQYKEDRDSRPPEAYDEFNKLNQMLIDAFASVGACAVWQDGVEGDDVVAYLAKNLKGTTLILSNDKDLSSLTDIPGVSQYRMGSLVEDNPWGPFPVKYIPLYKSLVGGKDNVPGAKGFGEKAFLDLLCKFGLDGLEALEQLIKTRKLRNLQEDVSELKSLQKIIDAEDIVYASYAVSIFYPEKVNTMRKPLQWKIGMVKPRQLQEDERLKPYAQQVRLVHKANLESACKFVLEKESETPFFALDIETSTPEESDEWLEALKKKSEDDNPGVDVFGSKLTGLALTFGANNQYTFYFTVGHKEEYGFDNVSSHDVLTLLDALPRHKVNVVHNSSFELTVLFNEWGQVWDNGEPWWGFLPNVHDTAILSNYVNENISRGLKKLSKHYLDYDQETYAEVTTLTGPVGTLPEGGRQIKVWDEYVTETVMLLNEETGMYEETTINKCDKDENPIVAHVMESRQYKMNELPAKHVLSYGADDTICTAALYNYFRTVCEIENTWEVYKEVEQFPAYLTALGFVQGVNCSIETLKGFQKEDEEEAGKAWATVREFLIKQGWDGTVCPVYTELNPANIKEAINLVTGLDFTTRTRTVSKFPPLIRAFADENDLSHSDKLHIIADAVENQNLDMLNKIVKANFTGEPVLDFDSPKQMRKFMYDTLNLPVRIINRPTPTERQEKKALAAACDKHQKIWRGSSSVSPLTQEEKELLKAKAKTDDTAFDFALAFDAEGEVKEVLEAIQTMKTVSTRNKFYYKPYPLNLHWKDRKLHPNFNQCATVTRRYSSSGPNFQQLPKKGEGVKIRDMIVPHKRGAVVCSIDFSGQELRLMAGQSLDPRMMACYVGDKLKDIHSITAAGAMKKKWGAQVVEELFNEHGADLKGTEDALYDLFIRLRKSSEKEMAKKADDLRKLGKNVNFAAQFDAQAAKVAEMLIMTVPEAQMFLDAKYEMFPRVETWKDEVRHQLARDGFVTTLMGARRHLADAILSDNRDVAGKAERQGPNFKIQGSAAEMTKLAMSRFWLSGAMFKYDAQFIGPIHDELVTSVAAEHALEFIKVKHDCMTQPYSTLPVPILGSISLGLNFGRGQIECGDWYIPENIQEALDKCCEAIAA